MAWGCWGSVCQSGCKTGRQGDREICNVAPCLVSPCLVSPCLVSRVSTSPCLVSPCLLKLPTGGCVFDLKSFNAVLLDMDGVLYRGQMPLPGVSEMLALFARR